MKIKIKVSTKRAGSMYDEIIEVDGETEEEIGNQAVDYMLENMLDWTWQKVEE